MLPPFLSDVFPGITDAPTAKECWVVRAIHNELLEPNVFSEALLAVKQHCELASLQTKLQREHPLDREHDPQHDARVRDCLTEACAFAWASLRELGTPAFCDKEGTPDIRLGDVRWIEVKTIHASQVEDERMKRMLAGAIDPGQVSPPAPGLYGKFENSLKDAMKKFERQCKGESFDANIVFFNLTSLDTPQMLITDSVLGKLGKWADEMEKRIKDDNAYGDVKLVMCYGYDWKAPFRDPFNA